MTSAASEPKKPNYQLKAGEINLDLIPPHWALTPLRDKRAYIAGWTHQPYSIDQIRREFDEGRATGVGLMSGQWSNEGGLVWVDIDGPAAIPELEKIAGKSNNKNRCPIIRNTVSYKAGGNYGQPS